MCTFSTLDEVENHMDCGRHVRMLEKKIVIRPDQEEMGREGDLNVMPSAV